MFIIISGGFAAKGLRKVTTTTCQALLQYILEPEFFIEPSERKSTTHLKIFRYRPALRF